MILFLDEDRAYLNWVTHHRAGFVLECHRDLTTGLNVLHRATCPSIKRSDAKRSHWTTGRQMKCCAFDVEQIVTWLKIQAQQEPTDCAECGPHLPISVEAHLTKLDYEIVDYVLEIAAIALDDDGHGYQVTVGMIANCLNKTPGQLTASFGRLVDNGMLSITGQNHPAKSRSPRSHVFPTAKALRLLDYYRGFDEQELTAELEKITDE